MIVYIYHTNRNNYIKRNIKNNVKTDLNKKSDRKLLIKIVT